MATEGSERRPGLVLSGLGSQRAAGYWRLLFSAIWLIYVIQPVGSLFRHHYGAGYIGGAIAIVVVFSLCYVRLWGAREITRRQTARSGSLWSVVPLFVLAALACVVYDGAKWNALWIYVSAACGAMSADRRLAARAVLAAGGCYALFSWIGHDAVSDFLFTLLPVVLVGFAMIGFRAQIAMMRELQQARETVARLAVCSSGCPAPRKGTGPARRSSRSRHRDARPGRPDRRRGAQALAAGHRDHHPHHVRPARLPAARHGIGRLRVHREGLAR